MFMKYQGGGSDACAVCRNIAYHRMRRLAEHSCKMAVQLDGPMHVAYNIT